MGGTTQIGKRGSDVSCFFKTGSSRNIEKTFFDLTMEISVTGCQTFKVVNG